MHKILPYELKLIPYNYEFTMNFNQSLQGRSSIDHTLCHERSLRSESTDCFYLNVY